MTVPDYLIPIVGLPLTAVWLGVAARAAMAIEAFSEKLRNHRKSPPELMPGAPDGVPDYVAPIIGYRTWRWDGAYLRSLNRETWRPGEAMIAICSICTPAPREHCTCGIYAAKTLGGLFRMGYSLRGHCYGEVYLWGRVVEHRLGWRAQFAYPKTLIIPCNRLHPAVRMSVLEALTIYGADIYQESSLRTTLLWTKQSGYTEEGKRWIGPKTRWVN